MRPAALSNPSRRTNPQSNPYPQPDFAIPGGNSRLSNKINPTDSPNQLIWTALALTASGLDVIITHEWEAS